MTRELEYDKLNRYILPRVADYLADLLVKIPDDMSIDDYRACMGCRVMGFVEGRDYKLLCSITCLYIVNKLVEFVDYTGPETGGPTL